MTEETRILMKTVFYEYTYKLGMSASVMAMTRLSEGIAVRDRDTFHINLRAVQVLLF